MTTKEIQKLAEDHGLYLNDTMEFNEMGVDFKVGFAKDLNNKQWVLRIPRRDNLDDQIEQEQHILQLAKKHLTVEVPDWKVASGDLIAYPLLQNKPALTFDAKTFEVAWNMNQENRNYPVSLAEVLVKLHRIPETEVREKRLKILGAEDLRPEIMNRLQLVKSELGISKELDVRYRTWLDNDSLWPDFTRFVHGDLYAGHILVDDEGVVSGLIDWSTAHVSDVALDFSSHLSIFGEDSLNVLIKEYEKLGGKIWPKFFEQIVEREAAAPLAYGFFAIEANIDTHIKGAKAQLGVE